MGNTGRIKLHPCLVLLWLSQRQFLTHTQTHNEVNSLLKAATFAVCMWPEYRRFIYNRNKELNRKHLKNKGMVVMKTHLKENNNRNTQAVMHFGKSLLESL